MTESLCCKCRDTSCFESQSNTSRVWSGTTCVTLQHRESESGMHVVCDARRVCLFGRRLRAPTPL